MTNIDFFKQQSKNFLKDYKTQFYNEDEGFYDFKPRFFNDIDELIMNFDIDEKSDFSLMNSQHIIAKLSGFIKWTDLIKASETELELGKLLLTNREKYQEEVGYITNAVPSMIVEDWKIFEKDSLKDADDKTKLQVFKQMFLGELKENKKKQTSKITFDFTNDKNSQDMLVKIMNEKGLTAEKAILSSIIQKNCIRIIETGYASIVLPIWGHDNPNRDMEILQNPIVEFKLSKSKERLINIIMEKEEVDFEIAILYFMLFELESLDYHI